MTCNILLSCTSLCFSVLSKKMKMQYKKKVFYGLIASFYIIKVGDCLGIIHHVSILNSVVYSELCLIRGPVNRKILAPDF